MQNTHAGTRSPLGPTIMPDGRLAIEERSMGRSRSREGFALFMERLKFELRIFSIEKDSFLDVGLLVDDEDVSEENDEKELSESGDPQLL